MNLQMNGKYWEQQVTWKATTHPVTSFLPPTMVNITLEARDSYRNDHQNFQVKQSNYDVFLIPEKHFICPLVLDPKWQEIPDYVLSRLL